MRINGDLWPDDLGEFVSGTPLAMLKEQAALLSDKTRGLVHAEVVSEMDGTWFSHLFNLVVPGLDSFQFRLFKVAHTAEFNTIDFWIPGEKDRVRVEGMPAFIDQLRSLLHKESTKQIVRSFIATYGLEAVIGGEKQSDAHSLGTVSDAPPSVIESEPSASSPPPPTADNQPENIEAK